MTYTTTIPDSPYALTTQAIVRLDPSPGRQTALPALAPVKTTQLVPPSGDETTLSHTSVLLAQALSLSNSGNDVRTGKIALLRESIAAGTYTVPSADVAGKLIQSLRVFVS